MPRDSGGIYSLPVGYLAVTGEVIEASQHNPPLEDIRDALTNSLPRNGAAAMTDELAMGSNKITGLANGTAATDAAAFGQLGYLTHIPETIKTDDFTLTSAEAGKAVIANKATAITFTLPAVASIDTPYLIRNIGAGTLTLDGNASETIEGATTYTLYTGQSALIWSNGSTWRVFLSGQELPGVIKEYAGDTLPFGYLWANGEPVSRTTYAALYAVIGTTYGTGDGSTTFNVPDRCGRVGAGQDDMGGISSKNRLTNQTGGLNGDTLGATGGSETHTLTIAQMPSHSHVSLFGESGIDAGSTSTRLTGPGATEDVTSELTGGGGAHNNVQPTIILNYILKY